MLTLLAKNFVGIDLSRTVSEINTFLHFIYKFKMTAKILVGKLFFFFFFAKSGTWPWKPKLFIKIALRYTISEINVFCTEIQDARQTWEEIDFWQKLPCGSKLLHFTPFLRY